MDDSTRSVYRSVALSFLVIGVGVVLVVVLQSVLGFEFFRGNPTWVGLFIASIGALLWWTVRERSDSDDA